ncbi:MAG: hypothetical protein QGD94_11210, partial [Planctomycetia bacterium]|nr:hypothetical protein [Planctomycetia bacterium]
LYLGMDDREKTAKALVDVLKMKPDFAPANNDLGYIWAERGVNLKKAEKMIRLAVKADPENPAYLDSLGWVLYKKGKFAKAAKWLGAAAKAAPHLDNVIWEHLGDVRLKLKDTRGAAEAWQKALDILQKKKDSKRKADSLKRLKEKLQNVPEGGGSLRDARPHGSAVALGAKALAQEVIE